MTLDVLVDGRRTRVTVDRGEDDGAFVVEVAGLQRHVTVVWIDDGTLLLGNGCGRNELRFDTGEVQCRGRRYRVEIAAAGSGIERAAGLVTGRVVVKAPMPGRVVRVLVAPGERVEARQPLLVVEAMKMENVLRAPRDGTVSDVTATAGLAVEAGATLVVIDG